MAIHRYRAALGAIGYNPRPIHCPAELFDNEKNPQNVHLHIDHYVALVNGARAKGVRV